MCIRDSTGTATGGNITFVAQLGFGTQRFSEFNENDFLITVHDKGGANEIETGDVIYVSPDFVETKNISDPTSGLSSGSMTLTFPENHFGNNVTNFPKLKLTATLEISKARETLDRSDIRLKTSGLPTYRITNTYGSTPLNADGGDLTAYPNVFLTSVFNDGTIGLNGTEAVNDSKQTVSRRGSFLSLIHISEPTRPY